MQFYYISVLKDVVPFSHYAVVLPRAPDAGVLELGGEIFVDYRRRIL